jgi:hypothetical protein
MKGDIMQPNGNIVRMWRHLASAGLAAVVVVGTAMPILAEEPSEGAIINDTVITTAPDYYIDKHPDLWPSRSTFDGPPNAPRRNCRQMTVQCAHE